MQKPTESLFNALNIFLKKKNNKFKSIPYSFSKNTIGETRYSPPSSKEWRNNVYFFNANNMKNLPVYDFNVYFFIKSYFNIFFNKRALKNKVLRRYFYRKKQSIVRRPLSFNKIFVSKPEISHTNSNAIITIFTYNREKPSLLKKIRLLKRMFSLQRIFLIKHNFATQFFSLQEHYKNKNLKAFVKNTRKLKRLAAYFKRLNFFFSKEWWINYTSDESVYKSFIKIMYYKQFILIRRLKFKLYLNNMKFQKRLLSILSYFIGKYYNKKVEFNIVNLKSIILNSDIFTEILTINIKKNNVDPRKYMNMVLKKAIIPTIQGTPYLTKKSVNRNLYENLIKDLNLYNEIKNNSSVEETINKYNYNLINNENILDRDYSKVKKMTFDLIKYKNIGGVRLQVKGRITRRYRADRARVKKMSKGQFEIKDRNKWTSLVRYRGFRAQNIQYSIFTSKRRIGAFAVKGWISGK